MTHPLGRFIRQRRKELGLSQEELAARVGVPRGFISRWEVGTRPVPHSCIARLAEGLEVEVFTLTDLESERPRHRRTLDCSEAPRTPVGCTVDQMIEKLPLGRILHKTVREKIGESAYDELSCALLRDTPHELLLAHVLLADTATLEWLTPLEEGCTAIILGEDRTYQGHLLRLAVVWKRDDERVVFFFQVPLLGRGDERYRVDFLAIHSADGKPPQSVILEADGVVHDFQKSQDARRNERLPFLTLRFDNSAIQNPNFISYLLRQIREKADFGRASNAAYRGYLENRKARMDDTRSA